MATAKALLVEVAVLNRLSTNWTKWQHSLFRPPGQASAGRAGLYILRLSLLSLFFANGTYTWESAHQAPADTIPTVLPLAMLIKYPQTFDPCYRPFIGAKCPKFWPKFRPQSSWDRRIFELRRFIGNQKQTWQGSMIGLSPYQTWGSSVPQLREPLA